MRRAPPTLPAAAAAAALLLLSSLVQGAQSLGLIVPISSSLLPASPTKSAAAAARRRRLPFVGSASALAATAIPTAAPVPAALWWSLDDDAGPVTPPSWEELATSLEESLAQKANKEADAEEGRDPGGGPAPIVTLYRDTNGWCPFCERIWLALRVKGIPYTEQLVSLQNKPDWYKALVPTALVPAVLFHGNDGENDRTIVWESADILRELDERFPDAPKLVLDSPAYDEAAAMSDDLNAAGFGFVYASRNASLTEQDTDERRATFFAELDRLDAALLTAPDGGPFRLGGAFTALDAILVPTLERWRYQLPLTVDVDILDGRPGLQRWFDAMDAFPPYADRVAGDRYSWTATNSMFLRYFGGGEEKPEVAEAIRRADAAAEEIASSFAEDAAEEVDLGASGAALEAAAKLIANHEAVAADCTREDPKSQAHLGRGDDVGAADAVLRHVTSLLLLAPWGECVPGVMEAAGKGAAHLPLLGDDEENEADAEALNKQRKSAAVAARTVAKRLCVPRDMGAPAARILRGVLATVAGRLEEET